MAFCIICTLMLGSLDVVVGSRAVGADHDHITASAGGITTMSTRSPHFVCWWYYDPAGAEGAGEDPSYYGSYPLTMTAPRDGMFIHGLLPLLPSSNFVNIRHCVCAFMRLCVCALVCFCIVKA